VVARLARLIEAFASGYESLTLTALAQRAGLPLSTTQRLVADLVKHRFMEKTSDGFLQPGILIRQSATPGPGEAYVGLRSAAVPLMKSAHAVLKHQVYLAVLDHDETLYLERVAQNGTAANITHRVARLPLLRTSSGLILLAHQPKAYQEKFVTDAGRDHENLRSILAQARAKGYVSRPDIITQGSIAISVPVLGDFEGLPAALTSVIPEPGASIPLTVAVLRSASFAITASMRHKFHS